MNYKTIELNDYYRKGVFEHFTKDCKCSTSITSKINVTQLVNISKETNTKFYINFLYLLAKVLNSRDDYKLAYDGKNQRLICYEKINPTHYVFFLEKEICTPVYSEYNEDYLIFYQTVEKDIKEAKEKGYYDLQAKSHPNYFDASYISWTSYESLHVELPDGFIYLLPIINWGKYQKVNEQYFMPVTVRLNHAGADGYLIAKVFELLNQEIEIFYRSYHHEETFNLETERLILRRYQEKDLDDLYAYLSDPVVVEYEPYEVMNIKEVIDCLHERINSKNFIAVVEKQSGKMIGNLYVSNGNECVEIGYVFNRDYWKKGYAYEANKALIQYLLSQGIHRIEAYCDPNNPNSWRLLERLGMKKEAYLHSNIYFKKDENGDPIWKDTYIYGLVNE